MKRNHVVFVIGLCIALFCLSISEHAFADEPSIEVILESWQNRRKLIKSLHIEFEDMGLTSPPEREVTPEDRASGNTGPRPNHETCHVWFSDEKSAIEILRDSKEVPWLPPRDYYVHNELGCQRLFSKNGGGRVFDAKSHGAVTSKHYIDRYGLYLVFHPVFVTYRHQDDGPLSFSLQSAKILPGTQAVGDHNCLVLETEGGGPDAFVRKQVWVDPARDYVPVRFLKQINERPALQIDCSYEPHAVVGHALSAWQVTKVKSASGERITSHTVTVLKFDANIPIPESQFHIEFPVGADVRLDDSREREYVKVGSGGIITGWSPTLAATSPNSKLPIRGMVVGMTVAVIVIGLFLRLRLKRTS